MRSAAQSLTCIACYAVFLTSFLVPVTFSTAAEFTVNSGNDVGDLDPGNGLCVSYLIVFPPFVLPFCTLRGAIEETNGLPGQDTIHIPSGNYRLTLDGINENESATGDLDITDSLVIRGKGVTRTVIDGNGLDRAIDIIIPNIDVTLEHIKITKGILPSGLTASQKGGGGIRNRGNLTLQNVVLAENHVNGSSLDDAGGGLHNTSSCLLDKSTIAENHASTGGGIYNGPGGTLTISSSTLNNNDSFSGGGLTNRGDAQIVNATVSGNTISSGSYPFGGGIYNESELEITQSTITRNTSPGQGGGLSNDGNIHMTNTIVAGNTNTNCFPGQPIDSSGSNLVDDNSCMLNTDSDIVNFNVKLDSLQDHGGPTLTHGLLIGSPAVDQGQDLSSIAISEDQRGVKRPIGQAFDIGAFETKKRSIIPPSYHLIFQKK